MSPSKPGRLCSKPGCRGIVRGGVCSGCGPVKRHGWKHTQTRQQRGYDAAWLRLRDRYIAEHPLCEQCEAEGRITIAEQVDHIREFAGRDDPLRLDWGNLRSLCERCHMTKTARSGIRQRNR